MTTPTQGAIRMTKMEEIARAIGKWLAASLMPFAIVGIISWSAGYRQGMERGATVMRCAIIGITYRQLEQTDHAVSKPESCDRDGKPIQAASNGRQG